MRARFLIGPAALLLACGCGGGDAPASVTAVRDSAGVTIVTSPDVSEPWATLDSVPVLSLGGADVEGPAQFGAVEGVLVTSRDDLWVVDRQAVEIRVFDPSGAHLRTLGGRGDGPGEFTMVAIMGETADGRILAVDRARQRFVWYGLDGDTLGSGAIPGDDGAGRPLVQGVLADGTMVGQSTRVIGVEDVEPGMVIDRPSTLVRWSSPEAPPDTLGTAPTASWIIDEEGGMQPVPFTANPGIVAADDLWLTNGVEPELRRFDVDGHTEVWRVDRAPRRVDGEIRDAYLEMASDMPPPRDEVMRDMLGREGVPEHVPQWRELVVADDGHVWSLRWEQAFGAGPSRYDVFAPDGSYLGPVDAPTSFRVTSVDGGLVTGVWWDDLGVTHAQRLRLRR